MDYGVRTYCVRGLTTFYLSLTSVVGGCSSSTDDNDQRIDDLERGEVDVNDVLDLDGVGNQLQIQRDTAARKSGSQDLSKNKERATFV